MADEVTKKDLQSLQGYCNNKIGEVNKRIDNACKAVNDVSKRLTDGINGVTDGINNSTQASLANNTTLSQTLSKRIAALEARVAELEK